MEKINQLEIFKKTIAHKKHQKFLFKSGFTPDLHEKLVKEIGLGSGESLASYFGMFTPVNVGSISAKQDNIKDRPDVEKFYHDIEIPEGAYIDHKGVLHLPGSMYHFTKRVSPLRNANTLEEVKKFPFAEAPDFDDTTLKQEVKEAHAKQKVAECWIGHMYEDAWQIRGYQEFLMDMSTKPEICEYILDRITEKNIKMAERAAEAGVDIIRTGDDVANQNALMFAPEQWRKFIKVRWARVYERAQSIKPDIQIWYHSDGNIREIIPELIDIGVTILNPVQPECMDVKEINEQFGHKLVFDGTIGTQTTMPFGTPEEVKNIVRERKKKIGNDGGLILSPTHVLEPEVPVANVLAFVEACQEENI